MTGQGIEGSPHRRKRAQVGNGAVAAIARGEVVDSLLSFVLQLYLVRRIRREGDGVSKAVNQRHGVIVVVTAEAIGGPYSATASQADDSH